MKLSLALRNRNNVNSIVQEYFAFMWFLRPSVSVENREKRNYLSAPFCDVKVTLGYPLKCLGRYLHLMSILQFFSVVLFFSSLSVFFRTFPFLNLPVCESLRPLDLCARLP